ncbi:MAG: hypothetical protein WC307_04060 [Candidatus Nanoarchaeia archaeon]|jgi:hypothetical protein
MVVTLDKKIEACDNHPRSNSLIENEKLFNNLKSELMDNQIELYKKLITNYPKLCDNSINSMRELSYDIPDFARKIKDPIICDYITKIDNTWKKMNEVGLKIHSYY